MARLLLCFVAVGAFRSKEPQQGLNLDDFAPICDEEIVKDTCRLLNEGDKHHDVETFTTWQEISEHLSSESGALEKFKARMGHEAEDGKVWISCMTLCHTIRDFVEETAVLPPKSDVACYTLEDETFCDVDVRPSVLKTLGPKSDEDLPDFGDDGFLLLRGKKSSQGPVEVPRHAGEEIDSDTPWAFGVVYGFWEALERLANLFRIYPDPGPQRVEEEVSAPEVEVPPGSLIQKRRLGGMSRQEARLNAQKEELAKAYMGLVIREFSAKQTQRHMTRWFGRDAFYSAAARREVLRVLNSVNHMISNVYHVYPGPMCSENTYAYVYPKGGSCEDSEMEEYACRIHRHTKQFVFYLCPLYFKRPQEMVETLVHEGSHHATAYTDDVEFRGKKAYGRSTCKMLAKQEPFQAMKNADNFCYYIQDAAMEVYDHPETQAEGRCPNFAERSSPDNDGDCQCPQSSQCHFGGRLGCPFSATARRQVYSSEYFNADCAACSCQVEVTTTEDPEDAWHWEGGNFNWNSRPRAEPADEQPDEPADEPVDTEAAEGAEAAESAEAAEGATVEPGAPGASCPENSALPTADSQGDCYCSGGRHCFQHGQKGCHFSGTSNHQRLSSLYFSAACGDCQCQISG